MSKESQPNNIEQFNSTIRETRNKKIIPYPIWSLALTNSTAKEFTRLVQPGETVNVSDKHMDYLLVGDIATARIILADTDTFPRAVFQKAAGGLLGKFVTADDEEYVEVKSLVRESGVLLREAVGRYTTAINEEMAVTIEGINFGKATDAKQMMFDTMTRIAPRTLAGGYKLPDGVGEKLVKVMAGATNLALQIYPPYMIMNHQVDKALLKFVEQHKDKDLGIISRLVDGFSDKTRALKEIKGIMVAALETTAGTLVFALKELAKHPEIYEKLRQEALAAKSPEDLKFARAVFLEASRLYPIAWRTLRQASRDTEINGHPIKKGTIVSTLPYIYHRDKTLYGENAEEFYPQRFIDDPDLFKSSHDSWNRGTHICAGVNLAIAEGTLMLAALAKGASKLELVHPNKSYDPIFEASLQAPHVLVKFTK